MKIHPATCNKKCDGCPIEKNCDKVMLTDSQKECTLLCGVLFVAASVLVVVFGVFA